MKKTNIGFFGDSEWSHQSIEKLIKDSSIKIMFICGRHSPKDQILFVLAKKYKIPFFRFKGVNDKSAIRIISSFNCELFISMSYDQIFKKKLINIPLQGISIC